VIVFHSEIRTRIAQTHADLAIAREAGDDYLAELHLGELEGLVRVAAEHGLPVDGGTPAGASTGQGPAG
jgi:hypothetical protein